MMTKNLRHICVLLCSFCILAASAQDKDQHSVIELILDASGSMMGHTESGELKITAAKKAVRNLVNSLPSQTVMALRAYGHQSPKENKDCKDTQLLVDFAPLSENRDQMLSSLKGLEAKGYTPITYVLGLASTDFADDGKAKKTIILVSDGKETCQGDPCAEALRIIQEGEIDLVIHCIGFGVDHATQKQLECISSVTGGQYFSASNAQDLSNMLSKAADAEAVKVPIDKGPGWLEVKGADLSGHEVINAENGEKAGSVSSVNNTIELPAGIYNVTIAGSQWKSIEVKAGETTVLEPGWLEVKNASLHGHKILEKETAEEFASVSRFDSTIAVLPGEYEVMFGPLTWEVKIKKGETTVLNPGTVQVSGAHYRGHPIFNESGKQVGSVSNTSNWIPLPPGKYSIEINGQYIEFELKEGQKKLFER
ncbi:MAG: VWA domain-containing protein [Candidatus Aminicenantes bacterium]|nr:VWA domain-containing protein [Candidatus Aminicenantes bacterium]